MKIAHSLLLPSLFFAVIAGTAAAQQGQSGQQAATPDPAAAAAGKDEAGHALAVAEENQESENKKICKSMVVTGTRMSKRVCHTAAQWDEMERATRSKMKEIDGQPVREQSY